jgi:hypothetical protein
MEEFSFIVFVFGIVFFVGIFSNLVVILYTLFNKKSKPIVKKLTINLAFADLLVVFVCLLVSVYKYCSSFGLIFSDTGCRLSAYVQGIALTVSVLTLTLTNIDRYMIICKPFSVRTSYTIGKVNAMIVLIWLFSVIINIPMLVRTRLQIKGHPNGSILYSYSQCYNSWNSPEEKLLYYTFKMVFLFLVPFFIITISLMYISKKLFKGKEELEKSLKSFKLPSEKSRTIVVSSKLLERKYSINPHLKLINTGYDRLCQSRKKVVVLFIISFVLFIILWLPYYTLFF